MENASKALIIAGAILVAILLISVGIIIMNSINEPLQEAQDKSNSQAAQMFNYKYQQYSGPDKTAQEAKALITLINSNTDEKHKIGFLKLKTPSPTSIDISSIEEIDNSKTYYIIVYTMHDGFYNLESWPSKPMKLYYPDGTTIENMVYAEKGYVFMVWIKQNQ